jgi:septal ring factor EnvC (AmiA/AmiB activator)
MSFSHAEEAVLKWDDVISFEDGDSTNNDHPMTATAMAELSRTIYLDIAAVRRDIQPWVDAQAAALTARNAHYTSAHDTAQRLCTSLGDAFTQAKLETEQTVSEERRRAKDSLDELEALAARLEYEISALESKAQDVEDGVELFERQVDGVERRADELRVQREQESFLHWVFRTVTGLGTGPD